MRFPKYTSDNGGKETGPAKKPLRKTSTKKSPKNSPRTSPNNKVKCVFVPPKTADDIDANWKQISGIVAAKDAARKKPVSSATRPTKRPPPKKSNLTGNKPWFDLKNVKINTTNLPKEELLVSNECERGPTKALGIDCEYVGIGPDGKQSTLARLSIVNQYGHVIYDSYVKPDDPVTDYRTHVSGVRPENLASAPSKSKVLEDTKDYFFTDHILVGHSIVEHDLKVLGIHVPGKYIRDTSLYFNPMFERTPSLKTLASTILNISIQGGSHDSVEDARVAMKLYMMNRKNWENKLRIKRRE